MPDTTTLRPSALAEFLTARLDEDEATARAVIAEVLGARPITTGDDPFQSELDFARRWTPTRVLADVAAKRWIVQRYAAANLAVHDLSGEYALGDRNRLTDFTLAASMRATLGPVIRILAQPYRNHPDWRQEWEA